ncbi:MAG: xanthine dehydrogenase family protein subunit M [Alphaproteobacteria bacterium]|nr:xanthine dehydrogenase family protein subunit M [Alphaproteobacteria bacterium]
MKPAPFRYLRPETLAEALALLAEHGDEAQVLAGGQSLMAMANMRLARPGVVVDINRLPGLAGIEVDGETVRIGALTRYRALERSAIVAEQLPLVAAALPHVGHVAIRNRGTIGGSLALADPAAELPACAVALDAEIVLTSQAGERAVPARDFFLGLYETARRPDELLTEIRFPTPRPNQAVGFDELARRHGDFAIVGLAASADIDGGRFSNARLVFFGSESRPTHAETAASALDGHSWDEATTAAVSAALARDLDPIESLDGGADFKLKLARVLAARVLAKVAA